MKVTVTSKSDDRWKRLMKWGGSTGCHQMPERSFSYKGYQFPICARCTGVVIGYLIAIPMFIATGFHKKTAIAGGTVMLADWSLQQANIKESTNKRRLITGIAGGYAIMSTQLAAIRSLIRVIRKKKR